MVACPPHRYILEPNKSEARGVCYRCGAFRRFSGGVDSGAIFNAQQAYRSKGGQKRREMAEALRDAERMAR